MSTTLLPRARVGPSGIEAMAGSRSDRGEITFALAFTVALGFALRLSAASHLSSHVDEAASILAAQMTAERGAPILPSGTLYLQGATLSYLLAPFVWLGHGGAGSLLLLRLPSVVASTISLVLMFRLSRLATGSAVLGVLGAFLLAIDPVSIRWGAMVRMYGLLQCLSLALALLILPILRRHANRRSIALLVGTFWFAVFTQIAVCPLLPAFALAAALTHGRHLLQRRDLLAALAGCGTAPLALMALNHVVIAPGRPVSGPVPILAFVGDHLISRRHLLEPNPAAWAALFRDGPFSVLVLAALLLGSGVLIDRAHQRSMMPSRRIAIILILSLYWLPILLVAALTTTRQDRYLLHVHAFGFVILLLAAQEFARRPAILGTPNGTDAPMVSIVQSFPLSSDTRGGTLTSRARTIVPAGWRLRIAGAVVVMIAAVLRVIDLTRLSLWLDEGFTALYARQPWSVVTGVHGAYAPHPPLYFVLTKIGSTVVAESAAGRLISAGAGIATFPVLLLLTSRLLGQRAAVGAALVLACSPLHLYYSQEARMYAPATFLVALSYLALVSFAYAPSRWWAALYGFSTVLALYTDYSAAFALLPQAATVALVLYRLRRHRLPLLVAGLGAAIAYLPWLPQAVASARATNLVAGRDVYLGAGPHRVVTALLALIGVAGDGSYVQSAEPLPWNRWPELRPIVLLLIAGVVVTGTMALRLRDDPLAVVVTVSLVGTISTAILVSTISPAFAERTVLPAVLGWALLAGAAGAHQASRTWRTVASVSVTGLLALSLLSVSTVARSAEKQSWHTAAADVAAISTLPYPLVTYSYGAVADTLIDLYEPDAAARIPIIAITDGELEQSLGGGLLPTVDLTRAEIEAGALAARLPLADHANDLVWYLHYPRSGTTTIDEAIARLGYNLVLRRTYGRPGATLYLDLFARGDALPGERLPLTSQTVATDVPVPGAGVYLLRFDWHAAPGGAAPIASLACLSQTGVVLNPNDAGPRIALAQSLVWQPAQLAALCPAGTSHLRLTLAPQDMSTMEIRVLDLRILRLERVGGEGDAG